MATTSRDEQEVIIRLDRLENKWYYYGDVPTLNKKWRHLVNVEHEEMEENGQITLLEGEIVGNVIIQKKMSEAQRQAIAERMKASPINSKPHK